MCLVLLICSNVFVTNEELPIEFIVVVYFAQLVFRETFSLPFFSVPSAMNAFFHATKPSQQLTTTL